jgi:YVTN family beta-propeller protein
MKTPVTTPAFRKLRTYGLLAIAAFVSCFLASAQSLAQNAYIPSGNNAMSVIDTATDTVVGSPILFSDSLVGGVAVSPDGNRVYVTAVPGLMDKCGYGPGCVVVIATATNTVVATIPNIGHDAFGLAVTPDGSKVYVAGQDRGQVYVIATGTNMVIATIFTSGTPNFVVVSPDGSKVYVAGGDALWVVATATNTVTATIPFGNLLSGLAVTPDGSKVYVPNYGDVSGQGTVSVIATATNTVIATIPVCGSSGGVAVTPDGSKVYVVGGDVSGQGTVSVIATATNTVTATISVGNVGNVGNLLSGLAVTPDGNKVYVPNNGDGTVSVIATATNTVTATISGFANARAVGAFIGVPVVQSVPRSGKLCNGVYDGTFNGSILVSAGQNCVFLNGGRITGNVNVAGNFVLSGAMVGGNLTVSGTGSFTLGPAAMIVGSLNVKDISPSNANNSICGTTVVGNIHFDSNGAAVRMGSADPLLCAGNNIGGHVVVSDNTSATLVFNNVVGGNMFVFGNTGLLDVVGNGVGGNLECRNNTNLIMGGGNTAHGIIKQCN